MKQVIGLLLAGGKGTRLMELTDTIPKPALHFGGKYRIIDFVLSNCSNSGIDTIGIITQFEPIELTSYIAGGGAWDLDIFDGGITVLPPYTSKAQGFFWQKGTAHAVYQHINYIDLYNPKYVLILSTDHIYKMDYTELLNEHIKHQADLTISSITVPIEECHRFGTLEVSEENRVISFEEKPKTPKSNLISMGVYVFNYPLLKEILQNFTSEEHKEIDFGKLIIPYMIKHHEVYSYKFDGYWQDIGTIESLWKANMDLIDQPHLLKLNDKMWPIYSNSIQLPSHHAYTNALIRKSYVSEGTIINGSVYHSIISHSVVIEENSTLINTVVMPHVTIGKNCVIKNAIIKMNVSIPDHTIIDQHKLVLITNEYIQSLSEVK